MHLVNKWICVGFLVCSLTACGGGGSSGGSTAAPPTPPVANANPGGIWFGTVFNATLGSSFELVGITLSTGESRFIDSSGSQLTSNISVTGTGFSGSVFAVAPVGSVFSNNSPTASGSITGTINERSSMAGTFVLNSGDTGTFNLVYDSTYERTSSLALLSGTWIDVNSDTYTVQSDGTLFGQDSFGCVYSGRVSIINPSFNAYRFSLDVSNCSGFNGTYTGLGTLGDLQLANDNRLFTYQISNQVWSLTARIGKL